MMTFEILCVTMNQTDFSKVQEMNIHSNVVFANQANDTKYDEIKNEDKYAKMITTNTRGVGINRNLALMYAGADICLFADDDVVYCDDVEKKVLAEFEKHPDADIIVFNLDTDSHRKQKKYNKTKKCSRFVRMPWGIVRIAVRTSSLKKANVWFTTLFGGGCIFPSGEDSMWLNDAKKKGLTFYVSKETIGTVSFEKSTWFTGYDEKYFYAKGVYHRATHPGSLYLWLLYTLFRCRHMKGIPTGERIKWFFRGTNGYNKVLSYEDFCKNNIQEK